MRRFLILTVAVLASAIASAQNNRSVTLEDLYSTKVTEIRDGKGELMRYHGALIFSETNQYLTTSDVSAPFWRKYDSARRLQDYGQYIWLFGLSYMASDLAVSLLSRGIGTYYFGNGSMLVGGLCVLVGGSMDFFGWKKLGDLADLYNTDPSVRKAYSINLGPTRSGGFGLTLNF